MIDPLSEQQHIVGIFLPLNSQPGPCEYLFPSTPVFDIRFLSFSQTQSANTSSPCTQPYYSSSLAAKL